jgi:hypothetical protein
MSDEFYRQQAARRARRIWLGAGVLAVIACGLFGLFNLFFDSCTRSFERDPQAVVRQYAASISAGEEGRARDCWQHDPYYDQQAGCSQACLANLFGKPFAITGLTLQDVRQTQDGKLNLPVRVEVQCTQTGEEQSAEIILETIAQKAPWKHWQIISSTLGGKLIDPWCD